MYSFSKYLKIFLICIIIFNIIAGALHIHSSLKTLSIYKKNLMDLGLYLLRSFEMGNRLKMIIRGDTSHNLETFIQEFKNQSSIKNILIYNNNSKVITSAYKNNIPELKTNLKELTMVFNNSEFVIYEPLSMAMQGNKGRMNKSNEANVNIPFNEINIAISLNNEGYKTLRTHFYNHLIVILVILILMILAYFYILKLINLYKKSEYLRKISERDAELGKFSNILAHEIKNPLSSIDGLIKYSLNNIDSNSVKEYLNKSLDELSRINKLINDFLYFGREINFNKSNCNIKELIDKTLSLLTYEIEQKKLTVEINGVDFQIYADRDKLLQVLMNLLLNSIQASPASEKILLELKEDKKILIINKLKDSIEIDSTKLFEPFYTTKAKGSGLGLSISKKLMELQGFSIKVTTTNPFIINLIFDDSNG
jgi:two-component system sensor histidine kinase HydH